VFPVDLEWRAAAERAPSVATMIGHTDPEADELMIGQTRNAAARNHARSAVAALLALAIISAAAAVLNEGASSSSSAATSVSDQLEPYQNVLSELSTGAITLDEQKEACHIFWRGLCVNADCRLNWVQQGSCKDSGYPICCQGFWGPHHGWYKNDYKCAGDLKPCKEPHDQNDVMHTLLRDSEDPRAAEHWAEHD
jgi:hypothetical protein